MFEVRKCQQVLRQFQATMMLLTRIIFLCSFYIPSPSIMVKAQKTGSTVKGDIAFTSPYVSCQFDSSSVDIKNYLSCQSVTQLKWNHKAVLMF